MKLHKYQPMIVAILLLHQFALSQSFLLVKDEKIKNIVSEIAEIEKVSTGFMFTEGPVWAPDRYLLFTDIPANKIYRLTEEGILETYMEPSGNANGLMFDNEGSLLMCQHSERQIAIDNNKGGYETVCSEFKGKKFNSPNDLTIRSDGIIYFTDPPWGLEQGVNDPAKELPYQGVFMCKEGKAYLLDSTLHLPNGIILSPDEKFLYVADFNNKTNAKQWFQYKVNNDGTVKGRKIFADASESIEEGGPDGMTVDGDGNLYFTGPGGVLVYDPAGTCLGLIRFPEPPSNCCFGGPSGQTLYVTARTSIYRLRLNISK
jgi:gluconolactonase